MRKLVISVLAVAGIAGCATAPPKVWHKEGATEETIRRDKMSCTQYGMQSAQANGLSGNMFVQTWINDEANGCMKNLGYR